MIYLKSNLQSQTTAKTTPSKHCYLARASTRIPWKLSWPASLTTTCGRYISRARIGQTGVCAIGQGAWGWAHRVMSGMCGPPASMRFALLEVTQTSGCNWQGVSNILSNLIIGPYVVRHAPIIQLASKSAHPAKQTRTFACVRVASTDVTQ